MHVSTGLSGWADLWCSTLREICSRCWHSLLLSFQYPSLSQWSPIFPYLSLLICYWLCAWVHLYEHLVFVLYLTLHWWGNVNLALPWGWDFSSMIIAGKYKWTQFDRWNGDYFFFSLKKKKQNQKKTQPKMENKFFLFFIFLLSGEPLVCPTAFDEIVLTGRVHPLSPYFYPLTQRVCKTKAMGSRVIKWQCSQRLIQAKACFVVGKECAD